MDFWIYRLRKTWLDKCLKSPVWEDSSTSNMVTESKHCWNLDYGTFIIFIDQCEENSVGKSLSQWLSKYYECLLTRWFPMTSILVLTETIFWNIFRCNYLRNKKLFLIFFFLHFWSCHSILNIFQKKMTLIADTFLKLRTRKSMVR